MAYITDDFGEPITFFLSYFDCATCGETLREDDSEWASLCQNCGEAEEELERAEMVAEYMREATR